MQPIKNWTFWQQFNRLFFLSVILYLMSHWLKQDWLVMLSQLISYLTFAIYPKVPEEVALVDRPKYLGIMRYACLLLAAFALLTYLF